MKQLSLRMHEELIKRISYIAAYEGRSVNMHIQVMVRREIRDFEKQHGLICADAAKPSDAR